MHQDCNGRSQKRGYRVSSSGCRSRERHPFTQDVEDSKGLGTESLSQQANRLLANVTEHTLNLPLEDLCVLVDSHRSLDFRLSGLVCNVRKGGLQTALLL